jgi:hypothetical protein
MSLPPSSSLKQVAEDLWTLSFPLSVLGTQHGRNVTVIRLRSGQVVLHSMARFSPGNVAAIRAIGEPAWLVEAMLLHDTFAQVGRETFPGVRFLAPEGFDKVVKFPTLLLLPAPPEWTGELDVIELRGAPKLKEHVFIHRPSRTLIVADLIFNFHAEERGWERFFHRYIAGFKRYPGMSRIFRLCIEDRTAFRASLDQVMAADFDRIIVGHGQMIETGGKAALAAALDDAGLV